MDNNDLMRRVRYAVQLDDSETARLVALGQGEASVDEVAAWRRREDEADFVASPDAAVTALLDGLVLDRRGPAPAGPHAPPPSPAFSDNNRILKQLRVALELQAGDVQELVTAGGGRLGKSELGALFRKPGARNYRSCGDQVLRWFLTGLATRRR